MHCDQSGGNLRFVGFELPCENSTDPQRWQPWEDIIAISKQLAQALDGYPAEGIVLNGTYITAMEDKLQEKTYAEWMPEGRNLGILSIGSGPCRRRIITFMIFETPSFQNSSENQPNAS